MSYCVHCGVQLDDNQKNCPLCGVEVIDPLARPSETPPTYPKLASLELRASARTMAAFIAFLVLLIPFLTVLACDMSMNGGSITWSRFVILFFPMSCSLVLPILLIRRHKVFYCVSINWVMATLTLFGLNELLNASWFIAFVLPISLGIYGVLLVAFFLHRLLKGRLLTLFGVFFFCAGLFVLLLEYRINESFYPHRHLSWSFYSLIPCALIGIALVIIDFSPSLKKALHRRLFL